VASSKVGLGVNSLHGCRLLSHAQASCWSHCGLPKKLVWKSACVIWVSRSLRHRNYLCSHVRFSCLSVRWATEQRLTYRCGEEHKTDNGVLASRDGGCAVSSWLDRSPPGKASTHSSRGSALSDWGALPAMPGLWRASWRQGMPW